jgi:C4-type Zn-finger protein
MGIEHRLKESEEEVRRCPGCGHISTLKVADDTPYVSHFAGDIGVYFICQNPKCNVERIYSDNMVMVSGR